MTVDWLSHSNSIRLLVLKLKILDFYFFIFFLLSSYPSISIKLFINYYINIFLNCILFPPWSYALIKVPRGLSLSCWVVSLTESHSNISPTLTFFLVWSYQNITCDSLSFARVIQAHQTFKAFHDLASAICPASYLPTLCSSISLSHPG